MKKAFSLLELLIVVIIIWVLMTALWKMFSYRNLDKVNFNTCFVKIYSKFDNFFQEAISQKGVWTWNSYKVPVFYDLFFWSGEIKFYYSGLKTSIIYLDGSWVDNKNKCFNNSFYSKLSGNIDKILIKAGLQTDDSIWAESPMVIYDDNQKKLTWYFDLLFCNRNNVCIPKYRFVFDSRTYSFSSFFCTKIWLTWTCFNWSK
jgi:hypothetical protein